MAKVLVTGVNGFTGKYVAEALSAQGHHVSGLIRPDSKDVPAVDAVYRANLADPTKLREVVAAAAPDRVVHLAAISFVSHVNVAEIYQTNLIGTVNLLNALVSEAPGLDRVLLASSANVYGNQRAGQLSEDAVPFPSNHYGVSKLAMEHAARMMMDQLPITIVRPFNYTGVGQTEKFVIPKIISHARAGKSDLELGNIDVSRDFSDVRVVANTYVRLLDSVNAIGKTLNVCSGRAFSLGEIIAVVESLANIRFDVRVNPAFVRADEILELFGSAERLEDTIGSVDMPPFDQTISWMLSA
jgi:nucleoside-diphosphate-sugar epimerase